MQGLKGIGHRACGIDGCSSRLLKNQQREQLLATKLCKVFNVWATGVNLPQYINTARIIMLSKENNVFPQYGKVRTIAIAPTLTKVYEKVILKRLNEVI